MEAQLRRCCAENGEGCILRLFNIIRKKVEKERLMSQEREGTISAAGTERKMDAPLPRQRGSLLMSPGCRYVCCVRDRNPGGSEGAK